MFVQWLGTLPSAAAYGIIWGIMAIGVYITYRILDVADLTVDGSICTGGATFAMLLTAGLPIPLCLLTTMQRPSSRARLLSRLPCRKKLACP